MAGTQTTLSLQDKLTGPLQKMMRAMDQTITVMEKMDSSTQQLDQKSLTSARKSITNASADLERLTSATQNAGDSANQAADQQDKFNNSMNDGSAGIGKLVTGLLSAVGAYKLVNAASSGLKSMLTSGLDFEILKQSSEAAFTVFLGDAELAKQYMDDMYAFALTTPFAYPDLLDSTRNLMAFGIEAENTFPIMQSIGDAVAGIGGGSQEMQSLADVFGVIQSQGRLTAMEVNRLGSMGINAYEMLAEAAGVSAEEMKKQVSSGAVDATQAIAGLVEGMDKQFGGSMEGVKDTIVGTFDTFKSSIRNAGADLLDDFIEPITRTVTNATDLIKDIPKYLGPAFAAVLPVVDKLNNALEAGNFDWFFQVMSTGLTTIAWFLSLVAQSAIWVAEVFANNWSWIAPILMAMGAVLGVILTILIAKYTVLGLVRTATLLWAAAQWLVNQAYLANPIGIILMAIVAIIVFVIYAMIQWAETTAEVIGFIVGMIFALGAVFYNVFMGIANFGIIVAEFFVNTWHQAIYFLQLAWIGFNIFIATILDAIGNTGLAVAEFFIDVWNGAVFGIQTIFYHLLQFVLKILSSIASGVEGIVNGILEAISSIINAAISGINTMIDLINHIPGINISTIGDVDLSVGNPVSSAIDSFSEGIAEPTKKAAADLGRLDLAGNYQDNVDMPSSPQTANFDRLDYKDPSAAYDAGYGAGHDWSTGVSDKLGGLTDKLGGFLDSDMAGGAPEPYLPTDLDMGQGAADALDKLGKGASGKGAGGGSGSGSTPKGAANPTGGKLDSIGKIDDDINIADEDLKLMLELADIRSIQNFRTLNPTVNLTGDMTVREEADIDKIVKRINQNFEDQMGESVEGVYS